MAPGLRIWQAYDSQSRVELFSSALETEAGTYLVDPIPLTAEGMTALIAERKPAGVVVTNINHPRAAAEFATTFLVPIYAHQHIQGKAAFIDAIYLEDGGVLAPGLTAVAIEGGPEGEIALHYGPAGGTLIVGDALINFEPHGFQLLPSKYCRNCKLMHRSLEKLLDYSFERILFAHGTPILSGGRVRVEQLLASSR